MSSPYDRVRDDNVGTGYAFDEEMDVSDSHVGAFNAEAVASPPDPLGERDYRK
jgi:hypothetical protein